MVTITRYIFVNIFQTEHFLAVKFPMGYESEYELKNMSFLVIPKFLKVEKIGLGSFNGQHTCGKNLTSLFYTQDSITSTLFFMIA